MRPLLIVIVVVLGVSCALAAEDLLFARLADRAVSKGDKDTQVGKICRALSLPVKEEGSCLVYQTLSKDESGRLHSINVFKRAGRATRYIFFFLHDDLIGKAWLIDEEGQLEKAASGTYKNEWSWTEVRINKAAKERFAREVDYWRAKENTLASEPDHKN